MLCSCFHEHAGELHSWHVTHRWRLGNKQSALSLCKTSDGVQGVENIHMQGVKGVRKSLHEHHDQSA